MNATSAQKYHINDQGKRKPCHADKRPCRYTPVPVVSTDLNAELDRVNDNAGIPALALLEPSALREPKQFLSRGYGFEFEDDDPYYGPESGGHLSEEISHINIRGMLSEIHDTGYDSDISDSYVAYAKEQGWDNPNNFIVDRSWGYYDEIDQSVELRPELLSEIKAYYYRLDNARDRARVLEYVRGKGYPTEGRTPVEALKDQLKAENNNQSHRRVDNATAVEVQSIQFQKIVIPAQPHYDAITPTEPAPPVPGLPKIAGVVVDNNDGTFSLVDGYHRTKFIRQDRRRRSATYFVLSQNE